MSPWSTLSQHERFQIVVDDLNETIQTTFDNNSFGGGATVHEETAKALLQQENECIFLDFEKIRWQT